MKTFIAALALLFLIPLNLPAAHILGGQLSYECTGGNNYRFTLVIYRDCQSGGAPFDSAPGAPFPASVTVYSADNPAQFSTFLLNAPVVETILPDNNCFFPSFCIEKGTYSFDVTLSAAGGVYVTYQRCCLNNTISNLNAPGETGMTYFIYLSPEARNLCNSSPVFSPPLMACSVINEPFTFDHSATDADGDSLAYAFCAPLDGGGTDQQNATGPGGVAPSPDLPPPYNEVSFINPSYSASQPIPGDPYFTIGETTGTVSGTPNIAGRFAYAICVSEFRNGVLLSQSQLVFQHNIAGPVAVFDRVEMQALHVFPNPAFGEVTIGLPVSSEAFEVAIFNLNGQLQTSWSGVNGTKKIPTDILRPGLYLIHAWNGEGHFRSKIVVQ